MEYGYLAGIIYLIILIFDLQSHNKKVDELFPDDSSKEHWNKRSELKVSLYGHGFLLILLAGFFIKSLF